MGSVADRSWIRQHTQHCDLDAGGHRNTPRLAPHLLSERPYLKFEKSEAGVVQNPESLCPPPVGAASALPPCVGLEGAAQYSIFSLDFYRFDVPKGYSGINGKPVGHMTLEAHRVADDLLKPCVGGKTIGTARIGNWTTSEFACPNDGPSIEREAVHGEGDYVGHLALAWKADGISYIASAHGHTTANLTLLKRFVRSVVLISPGDSSG